MNNPWKNIQLDDYESHMKLDNIMQLQTMNEMMERQLYGHSVSSVMILGVAGGNGLNHIKPESFENVYGVDINGDYLKTCEKRYKSLKGIFQPIEADLINPDLILPEADLVIANLLIEYIGYDTFRKVIQKIRPRYASCIIQINTGENFVSDSPYLHAFDCLEELHHQMSEKELTRSMETIGYGFSCSEEKVLPNGKKLVCLDYELN